MCLEPSHISYPAKFARGLIERIFDHLLEKGWLKRGELCCDPFGGVGLGGIVASYRGIRWVGVELEKNFFDLSKANFELHRYKLERLGCPHPQMILGDSRHFYELVAQAAGICTSPPFVDSLNVKPSKQILAGSGGRMDKSCKGKEIYGTTSGQIGKLKSGSIDSAITSPPYADAGGSPSLGSVNKDNWGKEGKDIVGRRGLTAKYGKTSGQIGELKSGNVSAAITSPPYATIATGAGGLNTKPPKKAGQQGGRSADSASQQTDQRYGESAGQIARLREGVVDGAITSPPYAANSKSDYLMSDDGKTRRRDQNHKQGRGCFRGSETYGKTQGQIGTLKGGAVDVVTTSPPYEGTAVAAYDGSQGEQFRKTGKSPRARSGGKLQSEQYNISNRENIGNQKGETYWEAMRAVYSSMMLALKPGGVAAIVLKDYCQKGKRVRLVDDSLKLLTHLGFIPLERIHAMLVKETRELELGGGEIVTKKSRTSFFRRLYESKMSEDDERRIKYEEVLIVRKPQ